MKAPSLPSGPANFSLDDCAITNLVTDGKTDPIGGTVATSQVGVLVDLDTQQQLVSEVIGMQLTVTIGNGSVSGTFATNPFVDINFQRTQGSNENAQGDGAAGAAYQSVLQELTWNVGTSLFLAALYGVSKEQLSIRFNVDAHHGNFLLPDGKTPDPLFCTGRVVGTIGPYFAGEPLTFTNARFLRPIGQFLPPTPPPPGSTYAEGWNAVPAKLDTKLKTLVVDLGNGTPWKWNAGQTLPTSSVQSVKIATVTFDTSVTPPVPNGVIATLPQSVDTSDQAYQSNAFVQELPVPDAMLSAVASTPLGVVSAGAVVSSENPTGAYVNGEPWVFRLDPGATGQVNLWANVFQQPAASVAIPIQPQLLILQNQEAGGPSVGTPANGCTFPPSVTTDANGQASFTITASSDLATPRASMSIPGQIYGVGWNWSEDVIPDQWNFASVKVFSAMSVPGQPTWWTDVYPILAQYAYLYPAMQAIINLNDYDAVVQNATAIIQRLTLPFDAPGQMPITRELSAAQRQILVNWMNDPTHPAGGLPTPPTIP